MYLTLFNICPCSLVIKPKYKMGLNLEKMQTCAVIPAEITNWLNWVIRIMWIAHKEEIHHNILTMEPIIKRRHKSFKFSKIYIADAPFRVDVVSVNFSCILNLTTVTIDVDFSYNADSYAEFQVHGFKGKITNFQFQGKMRIIVQLTVSKIIEFENLKIEWEDEPSVDFDVNGFLRVFKSRIVSSFAPKMIKGITKIMKKFETKIPQLWHAGKTSLFKEFSQ